MHGGLGLDHTYLRSGLDALGDWIQWVYYDQRGNGRSERLACDTLTFDQLCADADALRAQLGLDLAKPTGRPPRIVLPGPPEPRHGTFRTGQGAKGPLRPSCLSTSPRMAARLTLDACLARRRDAGSAVRKRATGNPG